MVWLAPAIAAGVSTVANWIGNRQAAKVAEKNTNLTIAENKRLAETAWQRDQASIVEMNKYNSPEAQIQRFTDAGLNKNLIYTQGNPGNQTQLAKYNPPNVQYNYLPKFRGNELDSLKDLPLMAQQIKNISAVGRINEAKARMEEALSYYSDALALGKAQVSFNQGLQAQIKRVFSEEEFNRFFQYDADNNVFFLKSGMEETFVTNMTAKWLSPSTNLEKSQLDVKMKKQLLKNLSVIPWLQPLIQFLNILK